MLRLAWPIVLANSAVPLLGLVDTAVIGNTGSVVDLGAIALGALIFNFVYWGFGFLRMGTTGFTAQASGAGDSAEVRATSARGLMLAAGLSAGILLLQRPIVWSALALLSASAPVEALTESYFSVRIWGAPASLGTFAILGTLVGLGRTGRVLEVQLLLNGLNIALDVLFAGVLGWGVTGIALGTAISEWVAFLFAATRLLPLLRAEHSDDEPFWPTARILDPARATQTLRANADILIRTLFLLLGFAWFTDQGARFGNTILAANHVLLQLVSASAYLLDGYAHATEVLVGRAIGTRARNVLDAAIRSATILAAGTAVALSGLVLVLGPGVVALLTDLPEVRDTAAAYLPLTALYVLVSFGAFQLDGVFIGATWTRDMRNASVLSFLAFLLASLALTPRSGNTGLWVAFVFYVLVRCLTLAVRVPRLRERATPADTAAPDEPPSA